MFRYADGRNISENDRDRRGTWLDIPKRKCRFAAWRRTPAVHWSSIDG
jgi:hypothetical protein